MALSDEKIKGYIKRLLLSRMRILCNHGFYGLLLMYMVYAVDEKLDTAYTDGVRICFGTAFLDSLSDSELDYIMMHEILHVALQHCFRAENYDPLAYNVACDIVVNSNILLENNMDIRSISLMKHGEAMHLAPDGREGYYYTAEEVYNMLPKSKNGRQNGKIVQGRKSSQGNNPFQWDDHSYWSNSKADSKLRDTWVKHFESAVKAIEIREATNTRGKLPLFAQRILKGIRKPKTDWRTILNDFVQEEVCDYSFSPPDRRFQDSPFFLPDFNEKEDSVENILFMIDTSASMSDDMISSAYSEVKGAIDQFNGKLKGWLGFFDAAIIEPTPFQDEHDFRVIKPLGGGGTDFEIIFEYVAQHMRDKVPASIVILTDGYAPFPQENAARGIPVLWMICSEEVTPPWGKVARIAE